MPRETSPKTLYLVDGTSQLFRAYFAISGLTNAEGLPTGAVYGFTTMLRKLQRDERPPYLGVAFDLGGPVFRHEAYAEYKANRPPSPEDLKVQVPYAKQVCETLGIPIIELQGYEADDLIATYAAKARAEGFEVVVVASDKDLLQLVGDGVTVLNPSKEQWLDAAAVETSFGVRPELVRDVLGLMGDSVDNVPGVPGIGQKTALAMVSIYGDLEAIIERAERFAGAYDARDRLIAAIDALRSAKTLEEPTAEALADAAAELAGKLDRLLEVERDEPFRGRLETARSVLEQSEPREIPAKSGRPAKEVARSLAALKRELKGLDKGSGKRGWYSIRDNAEQARLSKQLVTLHEDVPVEFRSAELAASGGNTSASRQLFRSLGFTSLVAEMETEGESGEATAIGERAEYETLVERRQLEQLTDACRCSGRVALVVETTAGSPLRSSLVGLAVSPSEGEAAYVPLRHDYLGVPDQLSLDTVREILGPVLEDAAVAKLAHDSKRTAHVLARHGLAVGSWELDTMVAAFLLDAGRSGYALETLAGEMLGRDLTPADPKAGEPSGATVEQTTERVAAVADAVIGLSGVLRDRLEQGGLAELYDSIDAPLLPVLGRMEARGVRIDVERLERMSAEMQLAIDRAREEIHALAGGEFNLDSPKQLREVLFERLGLAPRRKTAKSKAASTDAQTLEELAEEHPIAGKLLEYRELAKLKGTYVDALPRLVHPETGRIHTSYHPTGAATGRLSSSDPNLQNIPVRSEVGRRIREAFIPDDGFLFLAADYSQVELRVLAHLTDDPELVAAFRAGEDIHRHTASKVFNVLPDLVTDQMRRRAKAVNFGLLYGMSEMRLAREQGMSRTEARRFVDAYFERFGSVRDYIEQVREQATREAVVRTLFGRVRRFPQLHQRVNRAVREQALRAAVNTTIQGTAADLMKLAMLAVDRELERTGYRARILLQVHDELLLEVPTGELEPVASLVRGAMEGVGGLKVPLVVDQKTGASWLEAT